MDSMRICDVESDFSGRFAVVSEQKMPPERRPHQQHQQQQHQQHHQKQVTTTVPAKNEYYPTMEAVPKTLSTSASPATTTASAPVAIVPNLATPIPAPRERETVSPPKEGKKGKKNKKKKGSKSGSSSSNEEGQVEVEEFPVLAPTKSSHFEMPPLKPVKVAKSREVTPSKEEELIEIKKDEKVDILAEALPSKEVESRTCSAKTKSPPSVLEKSTEDISTHSDEFQEITNTKHETDEEEIEEEEEDEEEPFFIREKSESVEREEEETAPPNFKFNPDSSSAARPKMPSWMDDLIKSEPGSNPILKGIESAEKKYDEPSTSSAAGTIPKSSSTGFHLNFLRDAAGPSFKEKAPSFNLEDSSEDDFDFKPAYSRKAKKTKVKESKSNPDFVNSSSYADSESSLMMEDNCSIVPKAKEPTEGWSFEADDLDVNRIINEVVNNHGISAIEHPKPEEGEEEEKTRENLIFKFENELALKDDEDDDEEEEEAGAGNGKNPVLKSASLEDLKDALADDTTEDDSENDFKPASRSGKKMTTSLNVSFDEESLIPSSTARENLASSGLSGTSVGSTSDGSSVGNSPNPKKNKGKSKKKKRR